jgi:hypothetical protein
MPELAALRAWGNDPREMTGSFGLLMRGRGVRRRRNSAAGAQRRVGLPGRIIVNKGLFPPSLSCRAAPGRASPRHRTRTHNEVAVLRAKVAVVMKTPGGTPS